jgi:hydrogenase/urease accessory protein HupE
VVRWFFMFASLLGGVRLSAHPFLHNTWWAVVESNRVAMRVTATLREVALIQRFEAAQWTNLTQLQPAVSNHAAYVASHLRITAAGKPLTVQVLDHQLLVEENSAEDSEMAPERLHAAFDLEVTFEPAVGPLELRFGHDMLRGMNYAPGIPWDLSHVFQASDTQRHPLGQGVVRIDAPVSVTVPPRSPSASPTAPAARPEAPPLAATDQTFVSFLRHGLHHVLTGYDHLLFLAGLTLASRSWRRLLSIIATFTLAHSITVSLSVLGWLRLPPSIVEPVIAGSIVVVALQNVLAPQHAQGGQRLAVAFGFGLIHGLGFAGGLLDALGTHAGGGLAIAIAAFCLGVEIGHLAVGAPLFGLIKAMQPPSANNAATTPSAFLRFGSIGVALGGSWFLWAALRSL